MQPMAVTVFAASGYSGNPAEVYLFDQTPSKHETTLLEERSAAVRHAICGAWPHSPASTTLATRCLQHRQPIRFCGHGLLAIGWAWHARHGQWPRLHNDDELVTCFGRDGLTWWRRAGLTCRPVPAPSWYPIYYADGRMLHPSSAAEAGGPQGYRILELGGDVALAEVAVDSTAVARYDERALILVQAAAGAVDYQLRYFAPQYGNAEDVVTGSAHTVAAAYWAQARGPASRCGLQTPAMAAPLGRGRAGGVVYSRTDGHFVEVGGELLALDRL